MSGIDERDRKANPAEGEINQARPPGRYVFEVEGLIDGVTVRASLGRPALL